LLSTIAGDGETRNGEKDSKGEANKGEKAPSRKQTSKNVLRKGLNSDKNRWRSQNALGNNVKKQKAASETKSGAVFLAKGGLRQAS
jgi:hypothetical protein